MFKKYLSIGEVNPIKLVIIFFSMLFAGILEVLSIGSMLPIFHFIVEGNFESNKYYNILISIFGEKNIFEYDDTDLLLIFILSVILIFLIKNIYLVLFSYYQSIFIMALETNLSIKLYKNYIFSSFISISEKHSSQLIRNVLNQSSLYASNFIFTILSISVELITFVLIILFLFINYPLETMYVLIIFLILSVIYFNIIKKKIFSFSEGIQKSEQERIRLLQDGVGAQKEIKIFNYEKDFLKNFAFQSFKVMRNAKIINLYRILPRHLFEMVSIILLTLFIFFTFKNEIKINYVLPQIGLFALAGLRILPSLNRTLLSFQRLKESLPIVYNLQNEISNFKKDEDEENIELSFEKNISLNNIYFKYPENKNYIFENLSFKIEKGSSNFIFGKSGEGKSTLTEIIAGLILPSIGNVAVDQKEIRNRIKSWQKHISYMPQNIFLLNTTIKDNILFGEKQKDLRTEDFKKAVDISNLRELLEQFGSNKVGERGNKLSQGQIQRIGLARALYKKNTKLLIFDEITSNLDAKNEQEILENISRIENKKLTIIFISHNLKLSKFFENHLELKNKVLKKVNVK